MVVQGEITGTLLLGSLMTLLEGASYCVVGTFLGHRRVRAESRVHAALFQGWWYLIGVNKLLAAGSGLGIAYGLVDASLYIAIIYLNVVILCVSLWCLLSFLVYLLVTARATRHLVTALYISYYVLLTYHIAAGLPNGVLLGEWRTVLLSQNPPPPLRGLVVLLGLVVPELVAALAYLTLFLRAPDATARYRIALISLSIIGWTLSIFFVSVPAFAASASLQLGSRVLGAASALLSLLAYRPPRWIQRRLGVESLAVPAAPSHPRP